MIPNNSFTIFYSWQSDLPKKVNNFFILDSIRRAIKKIKKDITIKVEPRIDKDTQSIPGSPDIIDIILKKIVASNVFVCDITPISRKYTKKKYRKKRSIPNPNVLMELGYAVRTMGWSRIICVLNEEFGNIEDLPFDIRKNRVSTYALKPNADNKLAKDQLCQTLALAVKLIIINYDQILHEATEADSYIHDLKIFNVVNDVLSIDQLLALIESVSAYLVISNGDRNKILRFRDSLTSEQNKFLYPIITNSAKVLADELTKFINVLALRFFVIDSDTTIDTNSGQKDIYMLYGLASNEHGRPHDEFKKEQREFINEITNASNSLDRVCREFRSDIKKTLFI